MTFGTVQQHAHMVEPLWRFPENRTTIESSIQKQKPAGELILIMFPIFNLEMGLGNFTLTKNQQNSISPQLPILLPIMIMQPVTPCIS